VTRRTTVALGSATLLLAAAVAGEAWYLWGAPAPTPTAQRPVVVGDIDAQAAVDAAATDAAAIFSTSGRVYDGHLARVTALMTDDMAARYRSQADRVRAQQEANRTTTETRVAARAVVRATPEEVLALLFLDQRTVAAGGQPSYTARRALVTMVHTDRGWLVANVQTR
jgi:Mce-associated membrane protein